ncbi:MAG: prepilin-type N-terminal cleavage/methylation domain-containing protein [Burkholderiales bacterium]|nr:prepilin-type N-terminal cleavage/methylation domain-containing protein [Opitutaceae bacterium]
MKRTRSIFPDDSDRRGFTLIEIVLVLMLIALIGAVLVGGASSMLNSSKEQDPETALLSLLQKLRSEAVESGQMIELVQLPEDKGFLWGADGVETLPLREGGPRVRLIRPEFGRASLIGGQMEEYPMERLRFYPDGSCDPARVQVRKGDTRRVFAIDPWTAAPLPDGGKAS